MILFACLISTIFILTLLKFVKKTNLPPGPIGLPYFGYFFFIKKPLFKTIHDLGKSYGRIFSFTTFGRTVIVVNEIQILKKILINNKEFSGRTTLFVNGILAENQGISNYDGRLVDMKKGVINKFLRMNDNIESIIDEECQLLINFIKTIKNQPVFSRLLLNKAICNIIWKIVFGTRFDYSNINALKNVENVAINNSENEIISFRQCLPLKCSVFVQKLLLLKSLLNLTEIFRRYQNIIEFIKQSIIAGKTHFRNENYPFEIENESEKIRFSDNETIRLVFELFAAGTDTLILTLQWGMLLLSIHPREQEKIRKEIQEFIIPVKGQKIYISWTDRQKLRYCQQVIAEIHRFASVTPLALPHRVLKSCKLENFDIPYNSMVLIDVYSVHNDHNIWKDPNKFDPERFFNKSLYENIIPFSLGSRSCPGSILAQAEIFTILLNVVYNFRIVPVKKDLNINDLGIGTPGLTRGPKYHEVIFEYL